MARLIVKYLAIYNNENLPNSIIFCQSRLKMLPNSKWTLKSLPNPVALTETDIVKRWYMIFGTKLFAISDRLRTHLVPTQNHASKAGLNVSAQLVTRYVW